MSPRLRVRSLTGFYGVAVVSRGEVCVCVRACVCRPFYRSMYFGIFRFLIFFVCVLNFGIRYRCWIERVRAVGVLLGARGKFIWRKPRG